MHTLLDLRGNPIAIAPVLGGRYRTQGKSRP
jgi:hypothetical protein